MLTMSTERFRNIVKEAPVECHKYLVQVTKYQAAQNCKVIKLNILRIYICTHLTITNKPISLLGEPSVTQILLQTWIVGKWITPREQNFAPSGTHFHQFVVPPILQFRRDCTYGDLAAMRLPEDVEGLGCCEVNHLTALF